MSDKETRSFLLVRLGSLGDLVHTLPALAVLRDTFPNARIDWVVERKWAQFLELVTGKMRSLHWIDRLPGTWHAFGGSGASGTIARSTSRDSINQPYLRGSPVPAAELDQIEDLRANPVQRGFTPIACRLRAVTSRKRT